MSDRGYDEIQRILGSRNGLVDARFFVGRREAAGLCAGLGSATKVVWVHGAKRIGKTAFAEDVARRFKAEHSNARVLIIDASGARSFDDLLTQILVRADHGSEGDPRARFERLAEATRRTAPLLVVIDECDRLAIKLGIDEQALLRRLTTEDRRLCYLFVTHVAPARIVEEVSDVASRLLGVATPIGLPILAQQDVHDLFGRIGSALDLSELNTLAEGTWNAVGGHPLSLMTILQKAVAAACEGEREFDWVLDELHGELMRQMCALWQDLSPGTRAVLLDAEAANDQAARGDAKSEGFMTRRGIIVRPTLLMEASRTTSGVRLESAQGAEMALTVALHNNIFELNTAVKTRHGRGWFATTDEARRQVRSMRPCTSESEFRSVVNHLHVVVYEAARELDPARSPQADPQRWRIPGEHRDVFAGSDGIRALKAYRAHFEHDPDFAREPGDRSDRHLRVGKAFRRACGVEWPSAPEHWGCAHTHLLADLVAATSALIRAFRGEATVRPDT